jgi:hypothetical protein
MSYDQLKERCKTNIFYYQLTYITTCIQCGLDTLLNLAFKSTFLIYKFILNTNKRCVVFDTSTFVLKMNFSSMLCIFELCPQNSCRVYMLEISEWYYLTYTGIHISFAH